MSEVSINQRSLLLALFFTIFVVQSPGILSGLLLPDISQTFNTQIGICAQVRSFSTTIGAIVALVMGALSVKYRHKSLLLWGLGFLAISAIGCCYAPNLSILFITYSLSGIGAAMASPMTSSIAGNYLSDDIRPLAIGMLLASASLAYVIGAPAISQLADKIGWRYTFLTYILFLNLLSILLTQRSVPSQNKIVGSQGSVFSGFSNVLKTRSACACLVGAVFGSASWQGIVFFGTSFYRSSFELPTLMAAYLLAILAVFFSVGSVLSGRITNRIGRRRLTILGLLFMGSFTVLFTNIASLWVSFSLAVLGSFFGGVRYAASNNLSLEQLPEFRGTMMSLNNASINLGQTVGALVGGYVLLGNNWRLVGTALGGFGLFATLIYYLFSTDPMQ